MDIDKLERFRYVLSLTNVGEEKIKSASRKRELVNVRQMLMYFCKIELQMTFKEAAITCGRTDHSTAHHTVNKFNGILSLPMKGNIEAQRYKYILKKYQEKYGAVQENKYICVESLTQLFRVQLTELEAKSNLTPIQEVVNNAKKAQLEKIINTIIDESSRKMDSRTSCLRSTAKAI
jgi:hypothetical protein